MSAIPFRPGFSAAWLLFFACGYQAAGQVAPADSPSADSDKSVVLSPFVVTSTKDNGYLSTNSLSGGRLATNLRETPVSISVLNSDLLSDVSAFGVQDALKWSPNSYATGDSDVNPAGGGQIVNGFPEGAFTQTSVRIRGIREATLARDYFLSIVDSDTYNTERIDISRGPDALVFGDASLGGVVNVSTKQAVMKDFVRVQAQTTSYGGQGRYTLDLNRVVNDSIQVRINALRQKLDGWRDYLTQKREGLSAALTWQLTKKTQLRFQGEWGSEYNITPTLFVRDETTGWNHSTTQNTVGQAIAAGTGLASAGNGIQFNVARPDLGITSLAGLAITQPLPGIGNPIVPTLSPYLSSLKPEPLSAPAQLDGTPTALVSPGFNFASSEISTRYIAQFTAVSSFLDQQVGDNLFFEAAGNVQTETIHVFLPTQNYLYYDVNRLLPTGVTENGSNLNPDFLQPYLLSPVRWAITNNRNAEGRFSAIYGLKLSWANQRIGVLGSYRRTDSDVRYLRLVRTNGSNPNLADISNSVSVRSPLDDTGVNMFNYTDLGRVYTAPGGAMLAYQDYSLTGQAAPLANQTEVGSVQAFAAGSWLPNERIHTIIGVRRDYSTGWVYNTPRVDPVSSRILSLGLTSSTKSALNSPSVGAVVDVLPSVGLYANYSKTFALNTAALPTYTLQPIPTRIGSGTDVGVKYSILAGRVSGSIGYYTTQEINNVITASSTPINNILLALNPNAAQFGGTADSQTATAHGFEAEVVANLNPNWTLLVNGGLPKSESTNGAPYTKAYLAANSASWTAQAAALGGTAPAVVAANLVSEASFVASLRDGAPVMAVRNYTFNVLSRYRFSRGPAKGFFVGGGVNIYGKSYLGYDTPFARDVYSGNFYQVTAFTGYTTRFQKAQLAFQLNVNNAFNSRDFAPAGGFLANGMASSFRTSNPRELRFTGSIQF